MYVFSVVGISRRDISAACRAQLARMPVSLGYWLRPATTRAGMAQRTMPTIRLNTYRGIAPNFRCPCGTFCGGCPNRALEPEGLMNLLPVRLLFLGPVVEEL